MSKNLSVVEALYGKENGGKLEAVNAKFKQALVAIAGKHNIELKDVESQYTMYGDFGRFYIDKTEESNPQLFAEVKEAFKAVYGG